MAQRASLSKDEPSLSHWAAEAAVKMEPVAARSTMSSVFWSVPSAFLPAITRMPESSKISPDSATTLTPPPVVRMSSYKFTAPLPAYRLTLPLVAEMPSAREPPRSSTVMSPARVRTSTAPVPCWRTWVNSTVLSCSTMMTLVPRSVFHKFIFFTCVSRGLERVPIPPEDVIRRLALAARMSVTPSAWARTPAPVIDNSPAKLLRNWPRVTRPSASSLSWPAPAFTKVSLAMARVPVPAFKVMLPPVLLRSASSDRLRPAAPSTMMAPPAVVRAALRLSAPLKVFRLMLALFLASIAAYKVTAPPACRLTAAPVLLRI